MRGPPNSMSEMGDTGVTSRRKVREVLTYKGGEGAANEYKTTVQHGCVRDLKYRSAKAEGGHFSFNVVAQEGLGEREYFTLPSRPTRSSVNTLYIQDQA